MRYRYPFLILLVATISTAIQIDPLCQNGSLIAGANVMNTGFNARTSEILGLPIWTLDQESSIPWSPPGDPQCVYMVPKLLALTPLSESKEQVVQSLSASYQEFLQIFASYYSFIVGLDVGPFAGGFEYSKELLDVNYHVAMNLQMQGFSEHWWHIYKLNSYPAFMLTLDDLFAKAINYLPQKINSTDDIHKYTEIVRAWGTHNPLSINFGASIRIHDYLNQSLVKDFTLQIVIEQMGLLFYLDMFDISSGGFISRDEIISKLNVTFLQAVNRTTIFSGGASVLQSNATLTKWLASIPYFATPQTYTLRPISDFISDKQKSETWDRFVDDYLRTGYGSINNQKHILDATYYLGHGVNSAPTKLSIGLLPWFDYHFKKEKIWDINIELQIPDEIEIIPRTQSIWSNLTMVIQNGSDYQSIISNYAKLYRVYYKLI